MRLLLYLTVSLSFPVAAQTLGSIEGKVVNSFTGEGVKKAVVNLHINPANAQFPNQGQDYSAVTDATGKFHIDNVQPGQFMAMAQAQGFNNIVSFNPTKMAHLDAGQQLTGVEIKLAPLSAISGKVLDENGEPVEGVNVNAMRYFYGSGQRTLQQVGSATTDDRGQYRIFDIQPGRLYLIASRQQPNGAAANPSGSVHSTIPEEVYATSIYPGVAEIAQASPHELKPGEEWSGADFKLRKAPLFHVRGRVDSSNLPAGQRATVWAEPCAGGEATSTMGIMQRGGVNKPDGTFDLSVPPGAWCLLVREQSRGGGIALRRPIEVKDSGVDGLTLTPPASFSVKGNLSVDGTAPDKMPRLGIGLRSADGNGQQSATAGSDQTFEIQNVFPGKYFVNFPGSQLYVKSALYAGQDVSNGIIPDLEPGGSLSIVLGTDSGEVDGQVQLGSLQSGSPVIVVILPDEAHAERRDLYRINSSTAEGRFSLGGLAPGDYKLIALEGMDYEDAQNHDLLRLLESHATAVTVHGNGHDQATVMPVPASEIQKAKEKLP